MRYFLIASLCLLFAIPVSSEERRRIQLLYPTAEAVVRANGSVQRVAMKTSLLSFTPTGANGLEPGDTIIVPVNEEYQPTLSRYKEVSTVVFQSIASLYPLFRL